MPPDKQWIFTKVLITSLALVSIISISIGGANVLFELKRDVVRVEEDVIEHKVSDEKKWDKAHAHMEDLEKDVVNLKLQGARLETQYEAIIQRLDSLHRKIDSLEVVN